MFCCTLLSVHSSFAIILMGKRELVTLLSLSSWCLVMVVWLFLAVPWVCLRFDIVVYPDHPHFIFLGSYDKIESNIRAPVLFNLVNSLRKRDKILDKPRILSLFAQLV